MGSEKSGTFEYFDAVRSESGSIGDKQGDIFTGQKYREFNENYHLLHWHPTYCVLGIKDKNDFRGVNLIPKNGGGHSIKGVKKFFRAKPNHWVTMRLDKESGKLYRNSNGFTIDMECDDHGPYDSGPDAADNVLHTYFAIDHGLINHPEKYFTNENQDIGNFYREAMTALEILEQGKEQNFFENLMGGKLYRTASQNYKNIEGLLIRKSDDCERIRYFDTNGAPTDAVARETEDFLKNFIAFITSVSQIHGEAQKKAPLKEMGDFLKAARVALKCITEETISRIMKHDIASNLRWADQRTLAMALKEYIYDDIGDYLSGNLESSSDHLGKKAASESDIQSLSFYLGKKAASEADIQSLSVLEKGIMNGNRIVGGRKRAASEADIQSPLVLEGEFRGGNDGSRSNNWSNEVARPLQS